MNTSVTGRYVIHVCRIEDITARGVRDMLTTGAVAAFATHIPLSHLLRVNVISNRMAPVAERPCWPLHVVGRIEGGPPVRTGGGVVSAPDLVGNVPLRGEDEVVVADFREVPLLQILP